MLIRADKLQTAYHARQKQIWQRSDDAADRAETTVRVIWDQIKSLARCAGRHPRCFETAKELFFALATRPARTIFRHLHATYQTGHRQTIKALKPKAKQAVAEALTVQQIQSILVQAPSSSAVLGAIFSTDWVQRLTRWTSMGNPAQLAGAVASVLAFGKNPQEIVPKLLPLIDNVRQTARRVARMETLRVAHHAQMAAHESLGDLVIGYKIQATFDDRVRPEHQARSGKVWLKDSGIPMRDALDMEADDLPDAHNCRCFLIPVLRG